MSDQPEGWTKDPDEKVTQQLKVYVTEAEEIELKQHAEIMGMSFSSFARRVLLEEELDVDPKEVRRIRHELNKIGVNLNQLARKANQHDQVIEQTNLKELCKRLTEKIKQL